MSKTLLQSNEIEAIFKAASALDLNRNALLSGVDPRLKAQLPQLSKPAEQLWTDLNALNQIPRLLDSNEAPLLAWLRSAQQLGDGRLEGELFGAMLHRLEHEQHAPIPQSSLNIVQYLGTLHFRQAPPPRIFVGRAREMELLRSALIDSGEALCPVALLGMGGLGKTWLARSFGERHRKHFPGGIYHLTFIENDTRRASNWIGDLAGQLELKVKHEEQAAAVGEKLRELGAIVHLENVDTKELVRTAMELARALWGIPLIATSRYLALGADQSSGWSVIKLQPLSEEEALEQLERELWGQERKPSVQDGRRLVRALGYLPLATRIAAGHLRSGRSIDGFLRQLERSGLSLEMWDPRGEDASERARQVLSTSFGISLEAFKKEVGSSAPILVPALHNLGWAPLGGFGPSLGMAITGLDELDFEELMVQARTLSMVDEIPVEEREDQAWSLHPLMAKWLALAGDKEAVQKRVGAWILERVPNRPQETRGERWRELNREAKGVRAWLEEGPFEMLENEWGGIWWYASIAGGVEGWLEAVERTLPKVEDVLKRSMLLWSLANIAFYGGMQDKAWEAVEQKMKLDREPGRERELALDQSLQSQLLRERGQLEQALQLLREEVLPVDRRLGRKRDQAIHLGGIADILQKQGRLDEALSVHREEALPLLQEVGDQRDLGSAMGNIAGILSHQGKLDEAIEILRREVLPILERLGDGLNLLTNRANLAITLLERGHLQDREEAQELLKQALAEAERMKRGNDITWIRDLQKHYKLIP